MSTFETVWFGLTVGVFITAMIFMAVAFSREDPDKSWRAFVGFLLFMLLLLLFGASGSIMFGGAS